MRRVILAVFLASTIVAAQPSDPVVGNWRGTLTSAGGVESPIIITIVKQGDGYAGSTNGLNASSESALKRVTVSGAKPSIEAADDSNPGAVSLVADLAAEGGTLTGSGSVAVGARKFDVTRALQRRPRAEAIQPHVELVSVASWRSPIAITFQTSPVQARARSTSCGGCCR